VRMPVARPVYYGEMVPASFARLPVAVEAPAPAVSVADNVVLFPGHLFIDRRRGIVLPQSLDITYHPPTLSGEALRPPPLFRWPREMRDEVFVVDCHFTDTYGHNLLEALPRLMLLDRVPKGIEIATSIPRSPAIEALIGGLGVDPGRVRYYREPLFCRRAYLPERLVYLRKSIHPLAWEAFSRLKRLGVSGGPVPERIFISRSRILRRRLVNEAEIEAAFRRHGFHIVHPELLPIEEQISLFAGARMIAGLGGSAMHSAVFSSPEARVLMISSLDWFVETDVLISQRDGQLGYVFGATSDRVDDAGDRTWRVDPSVVEAAIIAHFGL
ncbi:glycosyltransferase 61 family protein, partial [Devosia sp. 66-14]